jgi:hypothetical protein
MTSGKSDGSLKVYASTFPFAIYFSDSYGFVILAKSRGSIPIRL